MGHFGVTPEISPIQNGKQMGAETPLILPNPRQSTDLGIFVGGLIFEQHDVHSTGRVGARLSSNMDGGEVYNTKNTIM